MVDKIALMILFDLLYGFFIWLVVFFIVGCLLVFWIFMLLDALKRKFSKEGDKTIWMLLIILSGILGAIIYYFMIKRKDKISNKDH